tara:strand:+ start:266 stop:733 length:468 start_codon:yes stop_codon:yes gene_type:complete
MTKNTVHTHEFTENDLVFVWETAIDSFDSAQELNDALEEFYDEMSCEDKKKFQRPFYRAIYRNPARSAWVVATAYSPDEEMDTFMAQRCRKAKLRTSHFNWEIKFQCIMAGDQYSLECKYLRDSIDVLENYYNLEEDARLMSIRDNLHYLAVNRR